MARESKERVMISTDISVNDGNKSDEELVTNDALVCGSSLSSIESPLFITLFIDYHSSISFGMSQRRNHRLSDLFPH